MKKVKYPKGKKYIQNYLDIFKNEIGSMQTSWDTLRRANPVELGQIYSEVSDILTADYSLLTNWYIQFRGFPIAKRDALNKEFVKIFNYEKWSSSIAEYFKNPSVGFQISSCHYCDMAYVNVFEVNPEEDGLYFLNSAPFDELKAKLQTTSDAKVTEVMRHYYHTKAEFEKVAITLKWEAGKFDKMFSPKEKHKHHFDLDHVLPKSVFGLVGISLYNLVPSCQICNQKLKGIKVLGKKGVPKEKLSPTSPLFDFENKTEFLVVPKKGVKAGKLRPTLHPQDYVLQLKAIDPDYEDFIKLFKLEERYQFHKKVALHWQEMRTKYTDARINMMVSSLSKPSFSFKRIKSDIFQSDIYESGNMSFEKLRNDILK